MISTCDRLILPDHSRTRTEVFRADVLRGLRSPIRELPCKYFYDDVGSELFEQITMLEEYYLTRTERRIMEDHVETMAQHLGSRCLLIEYGSGSSTKTRLLLDQLRDPAAYVPIDVSGDHLQRIAWKLAQDYPHIEVMPLCADFSTALDIPMPRKSPARRVVYFPGSTIGNLTPDNAVALLRQTAQLCGAPGGLLLGADLQKDSAVIEAAYNDRLGITAAFNRNLLVRINRELQGTLVVDQFAHHAFYNADAGRIEMHLVSSCDQRAHIGDMECHFAAGESIRTEYSHKYTLPGLRELAHTAGFEVEQVWTDPAQYFAVCYLRVC
jgi:dimethylhistidine N-methyltransferase